MAPRRSTPRDIFDPVALNAKSGFLYLSECRICRALVRPDKAEQHERAMHPAEPVDPDEPFNETPNDEGTQGNDNEDQETPEPQQQPSEGRRLVS